MNAVVTPKFSFSISFFTAYNDCVHRQTHSCLQFTRAYSHIIQLSLQFFSMVPQVPSRTLDFASVCLVKQILPDIHKWHSTRLFSHKPSRHFDTLISRLRSFEIYICPKLTNGRRLPELLFPEIFWEELELKAYEYAYTA